VDYGVCFAAISRINRVDCRRSMTTLMGSSQLRSDWGTSTAISGTPRYSATLPLTQIRLPLKSFSGSPNFCLLLLQSTTVKTWFGYVCRT
jgi:hypothetical protein